MTNSKSFLPILVFSLIHVAHAASTNACSNIPHADHPKALLSNDDVEAVVFLPDPERGYYRSTRFDWSGVIGCASYKGHAFWGNWFSKYDPLINDSITGPVEEFRSQDGALGYGDAKPGDPFVKVGVGVLRKIDDTPYKFGTFYPIVDAGKWTVHTSTRSITFEQKLQSPIGFAYIYKKTLELDKTGAVIALKHQLKNIGTKAIQTDVYDHDFFMFDGRPTGPGMTVHFPFNPKIQDSPDTHFDASMAKIEGNTISYLQELQPNQTVAGYVTGYSDKTADYDITVEDQTAGVGIQQTSDSPIAKLYLWSIRTTISPEAYIHLDIAAGQTQSWTIQYRLFVK
ncbi:hypothetical protein [Alloacidobacterium sp.]|uniref:hypothetical protein n=1 Tax=Alloacidobacterium sp. TaxID=2951999 RepID=UPI002D6D99DF|nr:hypothetical protein [Alloacidobacterium sp.]HYK35972.1 hypothetical protein [Alloacidobacterium sp.]